MCFPESQKILQLWPKVMSQNDYTLQITSVQILMNFRNTFKLELFGERHLPVSTFVTFPTCIVCRAERLDENIPVPLNGPGQMRWWAISKLTYHRSTFYWKLKWYWWDLLLHPSQILVSILRRVTRKQNLQKLNVSMQYTNRIGTNLASIFGTADKKGNIKCLDNTPCKSDFLAIFWSVHIRSKIQPTGISSTKEVNGTIWIEIE